MVDTKLTFTAKTIPNVIRVTRTVVWARGINARGTRMALLYFISISLPAFVNVWKRTSLLSQDQTITNASEIIYCTCTMASISNISRFACANVWSACVVTSSIYVAFAWICFAFVNICQKRKKKEKKRKKLKMGAGFLFRSQETREKKAETCCNFLVKSTRYFLNLFTLVQQVLPKACAINHSSYFATGTKHVL